MVRRDRARRSRDRPVRRGSRADHVRVNRALWQRQSPGYDRRFAAVLGGRRAMSWGFWRIPESRLRLLGDVRGRTMLELGCGAARWSAALARRGAHVVGLDVSRAQLRRAHEVVQRRRASVALVEASAEALPFRPNSFDIVFCDWGALTFSDPYRALPECARVLRAGGSLVFATASPLSMVCRNWKTGRVGVRLRHAYFDLRRIDFADEVDFQLPYSEWIGLGSANGLGLEGLWETQPPAGARSPYLTREEARWGRRWPLECVWKFRKRGA